MAISAGSVSPLFKIGGSLGALTATSFATAPAFGDYKAIVVINLDGGNDAMNTFPPTGEKAHAEYKDIRRNLGVEKTDLSLSEHYTHDDKGHYLPEAGDKQPYWLEDGVALGSGGNTEGQYIVGSYHLKDKEGKQTGLGIHAFMPELAKLYDNGKLSVVSNVGTLIEPATKAQIKAKEVKIPPFLFSHLHQYRAVSSLESRLSGKTGWAGRLADRWSVEGALGLNISFTGGNSLFKGVETKGLQLSGKGVDKYTGGANTHELLNDIEEIEETNPLRRVYNKRMSDAARLSDAINSVWDTAPDFSTFSAKNSYGNALFDKGGDLEAFRTEFGMRTHHGLDGKMFSGLKDTAKMIKLSKSMGYNRQIFNVSESGYDFHGNQLETHSKKLRALSLGVSDLYKALEEMGMEEEVLIVLSSEFGRTLKSNEDGTDHGWGGHSFMLCGDPSFNGGEVFGTVMTDLKLDGENAHTNRARIIPTTAIEQMLAPTLKWFGVENGTMEYVLPNLKNFKTKDEDVESSFLQNVFS